MKWRLTIELAREETPVVPATPAGSAAASIPTKPTEMATPELPRTIGTHL